MADFEKIMSVALPALAGLGGALDPSRRVPQALTNVVSMRTMLRGQEDRRAHMESVEQRAQASQEREAERHSTFMEASQRERDIQSNFDAQRAEFLDNPNLPDDLRQMAQAAKSPSDLISIMEAAQKRTSRDALGGVLQKYSEDPFMQEIARVAPELAGTYAQARAGGVGGREGKPDQDDVLSNIRQILSSVGPGMAASGSVQLPGGGSVTLSKGGGTGEPTRSDIRRVNSLDKEIEVLDEDYNTYSQGAMSLIKAFNDKMAQAEAAKGSPMTDTYVTSMQNKLVRDLEKLEKESKYFARARQFQIRAAGDDIQYEVKPRIGPDGRPIPVKQVTKEDAIKEQDKAEKSEIRERQMASAGGASKEPGVATTGKYSTEYERLKSNAADLFGIKE